MKSTTSFRFLLVSRVMIVGLALTGALAPELQAATFTVDTEKDTHDADFPGGPFDGICDDGTHHCSLRAAIEENNASAGRDGIIVPPNIKSCLLNPPYGPLMVTTGLTLVGQAPDLFHIDGQGQTRVLEISGREIAFITGVSIENGRNSTFGGAAGITIGEGSFVFLQKSAVRGNHSDLGGVGIWNNGYLNLFACTVEKNILNADQGSGVTGTSGGIENHGRVDIIASTIRDNQGIRGGGIRNLGTLTISQSTFGCDSDWLGGCNVDPLPPPAPPPQRGNTASQGAAIMNHGFVHISNSTFRGNKGGRHTHWPVANWNGGAISNQPNGSVSMNNSTINENEAIRGGGIENLGNVQIENSTISGNTAGKGGGIYNTDGEVDISFSTITNNQVKFISTPSPVENHQFGGGIANYARVTMKATILAANTQPDTSPAQGCTNQGFYCYSPDCFSRTDHSNATFTSFRNNLLGVLNDNCNMKDYQLGPRFPPVFDFWSTFDHPLPPRLEDLANNGGPTQTHYPMQDSPAINAVVFIPQGHYCPDFDQRWFRRPIGPFCDVGAVEYGASLPP